MLQEYVSDSPPGVVVPVVGGQGALVALFRLVEVLVGNVLVPAKRVRVREARIKLNRTVKEAKRCFVLLLKRVAVANSAPGLRGKQTLLKSKVAQATQLHLPLELPQASRVVLQSFQAVRFCV